MIRKLKSGGYRLYSRKLNPKTGKRRNLGDGAPLEFRRQVRAESLLVECRHSKQQRAGPGILGLHPAQPAQTRALAEALGGAQPPPQGHALSIGDVDVEFLHQSRRKGLPEQRKRVLMRAKDELRKAFGRT